MLSEEKIGLLKTLQRLANCGDDSVDIFMRKKLEVYADSGRERHAKGNIRIESIGFNGQDLHRCRVGDGSVCAAGSFAATTFDPAIYPLEQPAKGIAGLITGEEEK